MFNHTLGCAEGFFCSSYLYPIITAFCFTPLLYFLVHPNRMGRLKLLFSRYPASPS
mgnify:CR=1 FL=1